MVLLLGVESSVAYYKSIMLCPIQILCCHFLLYPGKIIF